MCVQTRATPTSLDSLSGTQERSPTMWGFLRRLWGKPRKDIYGLDHAVLNMQLPPRSMWMNVGYWESTADFPEACQALLDQVLTAGLLTDQSASIRVLDVGCGCGDQSLYLTSLTRNDSLVSAGSTSAVDTTPSSESASRPRTRNGSNQPLLDSYIGINLEPSQANIAEQRLQSSYHSIEKPSISPRAKIFCANGADPTSWSGDLQSSIDDLAATSQNPDTANWLLALDTMYHFRPSRLPLLRDARNTLHASFMAFDLILADNAAWRQCFLLRLVCWVTGSPYGNFISREKYLRLLEAAGYDLSQVEIRDITRHVFPGLAGFLDRRVKDGEIFGLKMARYKAARVVFRWWANSGIVRGVVVVAKRG